jgi:hypothetical protein
LILTLLTPELYVKLQNFKVALDILKYLEVMFGELYHISKQNTNTEMTEVLSIYNEIVKLKQLGLLNAEVDDQSKIDDPQIHDTLFLRNSDVSLKAKMFALRRDW